MTEFHIMDHTSNSQVNMKTSDEGVSSWGRHLNVSSDGTEASWHLFLFYKNTNLTVSELLTHEPH